MTTALVLLCAYLLGSIPFGLLLTRMAGLGDIRNMGSGNIGATNVLRTGNKFLALATLLLDAGKGFAAVKLVSLLGAPHAVGLSYLAGIAAVAGHIFPLWLGFKGGKGVATGMGVYFAFYPPLGIAMLILWLAIFSASRLVSLASIFTLGLAPLISLAGNYSYGGTHNYSDLVVVTAFISLLVIWRHSSNIQRLIDDTEPRFGRPRQAA